MSNGKRILICPLNWGLGHATRCIPIINAFIAEGWQPVIAASGRPLHLLQKAFPALEFVLFPDYDIRYGKYMTLSMMLQFPSLVYKIRKEQRILQSLIEEYRIDAVFSDNRFGLYTSKVPCVYMTHQLAIQAPLGAKMLFWMHRWFVRKYDACWVPDVEGSPNLSGKLSHGMPLDEHIYFIGSLSRFVPSGQNIVEARRLLVVLSGPEPQRSILESKVKEACVNHDGEVVIVRGVTESEGQYTSDRIRVLDAPTTAELQEEIEKAEWIVSRPGYSSMMDYSCFDKKLILIPTPGQTEQEYLASHYSKHNTVVCMTQDQFDLKKAFIESNEKGSFRYNAKEQKDWKALLSLFQGKRKS